LSIILGTQNMKSVGSDGESAAANRYLTQRYTMPTGMAKGALTDIGTEELAHWEIIATLFYKLMKGVTPAQAKAAEQKAGGNTHPARLILILF